MSTYFINKCIIIFTNDNESLIITKSDFINFVEIWVFSVQKTDLFSEKIYFDVPQKCKYFYCEINNIKLFFTKRSQKSMQEYVSSFSFSPSKCK